jgi:hemerythrin-like domain-containing protein
MSLLETLSQEHREVSRLIDGVLASSDPAERRRLFEEAASKLIAHAEAEDRVLYKPLLQKGGDARQLMLFAEEEHVLLEGIVRGLRRRENTESDSWMHMCNILSSALAHHVSQEENEAFPEARRHFSAGELDRMDQEFRTEKGRY